MVDRFNELKAQTSSNDLNDIITRPMTAHEEEMYTQFLNRDDDDLGSTGGGGGGAGGGGGGGGTAAAPPPPPTGRPRRAAATAGREGAATEDDERNRVDPAGKQLRELSPSLNLLNQLAATVTASSRRSLPLTIRLLSRRGSRPGKERKRKAGELAGRGD